MSLPRYVILLKSEYPILDQRQNLSRPIFGSNGLDYSKIC